MILLLYNKNIILVLFNKFDPCTINKIMILVLLNKITILLSTIKQNNNPCTI